DIEGTVARVGELTAENVVLPDDELARAITDAGMVYLSLFYHAPVPVSAASPLKQRIAELLREDFGLTGEEIAARLGVEPAAVNDVLAGVKSSVARELVARELERTPPPGAEEVHAALLDTPFERETADGRDI